MMLLLLHSAKLRTEIREGGSHAMLILQTAISVMIWVLEFPFSMFVTRIVPKEI